MAYGSANKVRELLGLDSEALPDAVIEPFLEDATHMIIRRVTARVRNEEPREGDTDKEYFLDYSFIADVDGSGIVDKTDLHVFGWTETEDPGTKVELTVSSILPLDGKVVLQDSPLDIYGKITVEYSYYPYQFDWTLVDLAASYYAAKMSVERELLLVPRTYRLGRMTIKGYEYWEVLNSNYEKVIHKLMVLPMDKVTYKKLLNRKLSLDPRIKVAT